MTFIKDIEIPTEEEITKVSRWWNNKCVLLCTCNTNCCKYCKTRDTLKGHLYK